MYCNNLCFIGAKILSINLESTKFCRLFVVYINKRSNMDKNNEKEKSGVEASREELLFMKHHMPRGMVSMVCHRTGATRSKVLYQITQMPESQDREIIKATRDIFRAVTQLEYEPKP